jgi:mannan endo-1,4-beta-mannosidase
MQRVSAGPTSRRGLLAVVAGQALAIAACGTEYADPIVGAADAAYSSSADPCRVWKTQADCQADTAHGCSFQPNLVGCHAGDPACPAGSCGGGDPFVRRTAETLWLHGAPYSFVGTVSWSVAGADGSGCWTTSYSTPDAALARTFDDLSDMRVSVLRLWAFQSYAGPGGADYANFERVVAYARRAGVRLILVLENMWRDCTQGGQRDDAWFSSGYRSPYGTYALGYRDYVNGVVAHFRNEPTLLGWELVHEAQGSDFAALDGFAQDMSALVRAADPNHLISLGTDNGDSAATSRAGNPSNYQRLHAHPEIDWLDLQDFDAPDIDFPASTSEQQAVANALAKPIFNGAAGLRLGENSAAALTSRGAAITAKLEAAFARGFVGFLVYDYYPSWSDPSYDFDSRAGEPLAGAQGILARHARTNQ